MAGSEKRLIRRRTDHGAAAVEFALVLVPLLVIVFGLIQYGLYFWAMQGGSDIARDAARRAAVGDPATCAAFRSHVQTEINNLTGTGSTATITRSYDNSNPTPGVQVDENVTISVRFTSFDLGFPFVPFIRNGVVNSTAQARVENVPTQPETCS